jgi:hypothetical protein
MRTLLQPRISYDVSSPCQVPQSVRHFCYLACTCKHAGGLLFRDPFSTLSWAGERHAGTQQRRSTICVHRTKETRGDEADGLSNSPTRGDLVVEVVRNGKLTAASLYQKALGLGTHHAFFILVRQICC